MDQDIKDYVKKCPICQLEKTTRIKNQSESIIPDIPLNPNNKIALDIFGPLSTTPRGNKYILSIQDRLTRYTTLIPLKSDTSTAIVEALIEQYIYIYGSPKTILTDQGSNFLSELTDQFEKALKIKHIKTTAFHPQSNGNIGRMHSTLNNLIKTSKLEQYWKGPYEVIDYLDNNNLRIKNKDKILRVHINQCMPYFSDEDPDTPDRSTD